MNARRAECTRKAKAVCFFLQELLAILYERGPSTEGIFRKAANKKARRELKDDLNRGGNADLASKPVLLLAVVPKDFLRNISSKLLVADLRDKWLLALEKAAAKLPRANLLLLRRLLSLLHHISQKAESNWMHASNLAVCVGPNTLSPSMDSVLPLDVQKFLIENCAAVFGEDPAHRQLPRWTDDCARAAGSNSLIAYGATSAEMQRGAEGCTGCGSVFLRGRLPVGGKAPARGAWCHRESPLVSSSGH
uniref:Rho-GAP domain-containing protein n=1 Tax=Dromaius novaehollandiae TaxID=8790 RepID=A0A8C4PE34_DRONO